MLFRLIRRLAYIFKHRERERLLAEEIRVHLDFHVQELMEGGMTKEAAEQSARRQFGNSTLIREDARAVWIARWLEDLVQDVRYAFRSLRRQPGLAIVAILSASVGIGACCTIFGIANFALFRPVQNAEEPDSLVKIVKTNRGEPESTFAFPEIGDIRERNASLAAVGAIFPFVPANLGSAEQAHREWGWLVTANYFDILGIRAHLGRMFAGEDDRPGAPPAIILSYELWRSRFGADPSIVGREILFNGRGTTLLGVAPPGFRGHEVGMAASFWVPLSMLGRIQFPKGGFELLHDRRTGWFWPIARLRRGRPLAQASADLARVANEFRAEHPERWKESSLYVERAGKADPGIRNLLRVFFTVLLGVALLVLLIGCVNVANLLLARASSRQQEIGTRLALGAGRGRLIRQFTTESLILAFLGGMGGFGLGALGTRMLGLLELPVQLPVDFRISLDLKAALFAAGLSVLTGLLFGLAPALHASRQELVSSLKTATSSAAGWRRFGLRNTLVMAQIAVSTILLIASTLFLRSLSTARNIDIGMSARQLLFANLDPMSNGYSPAQTLQFFERLATQVAALPRVRSVTYTNLLPLSFITASAVFVPDSRKSNPQAKGIHVQAVMTAPRYFETLGIPLLRGRDFGGEHPNSEPVVIVNEAFARKAFGRQDPIGRHVYRDGTPYRIIGLAATAKVRTIGEAPEPQVYHCIAQMIDKEDMPLGLTVAVRTEGAPVALLPAIRGEVARLDRSLAIFDTKTMQTHLRNALLLPRLAALMLGLAGATGLLIATVGIYGVVSFGVARRMREIGIRMAIGAGRSEVLIMILRQALNLACLGVLTGLAIAFPAMRVAGSLLYGITPSDPVTFVVIPLGLLVVAAVSSLIPALRASRVDPIRILRSE